MRVFQSDPQDDTPRMIVFVVLRPDRVKCHYHPKQKAVKSVAGKFLCGECCREVAYKLMENLEEVSQ